MRSSAVRLSRFTFYGQDSRLVFSQNLSIFFQELARLDPHHVNAENLFKQPAKRWGTTLKRHVFDKYIIGPFTSATEDFTLPAVQGRFVFKYLLNIYINVNTAN